MPRSNADDKPIAVQAAKSHANTAAALEKAFVELVASGKRVSIAGVAKAAGVTGPLVHNQHGSIARKINAHNGKSSRDQLGNLREKLSKVELKLNELRLENKSFERDLKQLASINEGLRRKLITAEAIASAKNVLPIRPSKQS